jgi:hypothetical protein
MAPVYPSGAAASRLGGKGIDNGGRALARDGASRGGETNRQNRDLLPVVNSDFRKG